MDTPKPVDTIKQIIPANGWRAAFKDGDERIFAPLICWALFEDAEGRTYVDGIDNDPQNGGVPVSEVRNFEGYVAPGESTPSD